MADNASLHIDLSVFSQMPGYADDAYNYIVSAKNYLSTFNTELSNSGFLNRANDYYYTNTISSINASVANIQVDTSSVRDNGNNIVSLVSEYEAGQYTGETATVVMDDVSAEDIADATGAETGKAEGEPSFWDNVLGFFVEVGSAIWNFIENCAATFLDLVSSLLEGIGELLEGIVDAAVLLGGTLVAWGASAINFIFGTEIDVDGIKDWTQSFVATRYVESAFNSFYENTGLGRWIADNSYIYDTFVKDIIIGTTKWAGILAIGALITYLTGGAGLPKYVALVSAVYGLGSGAELGYNYGLGYYGGAGVGLIKASIDALMGYSLGKSYQGVYDHFLGSATSSGSPVASSTASSLGNEAGTQAVTSGSTGTTVINPAGTLASQNIATVTASDGSQFLVDSASGHIFDSAGTLLGRMDFATGELFDVSGTLLTTVPHSTVTSLVPYTASTAIGPYLGTTGVQSILPAIVESAGLPAVGSTLAETALQTAGTTIAETVLPSIGSSLVSASLPTIGAGILEAAVQHNHPTGVGKLSGIPAESETVPYTQPKDDDDEPKIDEKEDPKPIIPINDESESEKPMDDEPDNGEPQEKPGAVYVDPGSGGNPPYVNPGSGGNPQYTDPGTTEQPQPTATETPQPTTTVDPQPTTTETPQTTEPDTTEDREPNVTFINVGPEAINITPTGYKYDYQPAYDGGSSGSAPAYVDPGQSSTPEYTAPEVTEEPVYTFESMTPTVESPDLPDIEVDASLRNGNGLETVSNNVQMQSIEVTPLSDITANVNPRAETMVLNDFGGTTTLDPSALGMGGVTVGAGIATAYGANKERSEKRKSEEDEEKNEREGFNQ